MNTFNRCLKVVKGDMLKSNFTFVNDGSNNISKCPVVPVTVDGVYYEPVIDSGVVLGFDVWTNNGRGFSSRLKKE